MTRDELQLLPAVLDVPTAARVMVMAESSVYELIRSGRWPTRVLRLGRSIRIPTDELLQLLEPENRPRRLRVS